MPASHADYYNGMLAMYPPGAGQSSFLIKSFTESMSLLKPAGSANNDVGMLR